ncbi:MAG: hypothetical protein AAF984_10295, partial [Verrucomicrobiota bacterium]
MTSNKLNVVETCVPANLVIKEKLFDLLWTMLKYKPELRMIFVREDFAYISNCQWAIKLPIDMVKERNSNPKDGNYDLYKCEYFSQEG